MPRFPRLIDVAHKGFLPGPYENRLALGEVVQNMAGLTYRTGPSGRPLRAGTSVNDIISGTPFLLGVYPRVPAFNARELQALPRAGPGTYNDASTAGLQDRALPASTVPRAGQCARHAARLCGSALRAGRRTLRQTDRNPGRRLHRAMNFMSIQALIVGIHLARSMRGRSCSPPMQRD